MAIPTRQQWTKLRDSAGGKQGLAKSVSVGKLLDDYHKSAAGLKGLDGLLAQVRPLGQLSQGLKKYQAEIGPAQKKLSGVVTGIQTEISQQVKLGERLANPVNNVMKQIQTIQTEIQAVYNKPSLDAYTHLYDRTIPAAQKAFLELERVDPKMKAFLREPYNSFYGKIAQAFYSPEALVKRAEKDKRAVESLVQQTIKVTIASEFEDLLRQLRGNRVTLN